MQYFCAECQEKHDVTDIAADLYSICIEEVRRNLPILREYNSSDEFINRFMRISKFCNTPEKSRRAFMFNLDQLKARLKDASWKGDAVCGTLELTVGWLLDVYRSSGAAEEDEKECADAKPPMALFPLEDFGSEVKSRVLFSMNMDFVFSRVPDPDAGGRTVLVFNNIGPGSTGKGNAFHGTSYKRVCPHCGKNVSTAVGKAPETVVALAGSPRAGKTSCITAIASALRSHRYIGYGISMTINEHDEPWQRMVKNVELFDEGRIVEKTPVDINEVPSYSYLIDVDHKSQRVMTFVDMPGEFWQGGSGLTDEFFDKYGKLYQNIDCVWFFISKLAVRCLDLGEENTLTEETDYQDSQTLLRSKTADSSSTISGSSAGKIDSILSSLKQYLESHEHQMPPFAVILTKSEVIYDENDFDEIRNMEQFKIFPARNGRVIGENLNGINNAEVKSALERSKVTENRMLKEFFFHGRSSQVRDYICKVNDPLRQVIERNCPRRFYISMAAYGHAAALPESGSDRMEAKGIQAVPPTPFHEMYPLIWTLAITDGLDIEHRGSWFTPSFTNRLLNNGRGEFSYGTVESKFHFEKPVQFRKKRPTEEEEDQAKVWADISANLLMNGNEKRKYTHTQFDHPRR